MPLIPRIKARLGYDTTVEKTYEEPRYEYTVTHLNGDTSECEGNRHDRDNGFLLVKEADDETWARLTIHRGYDACKPWPPNSGYDTVRELEGVKEVERERIGTDRWTLTIQKTDNSIETVDRQFIPDN